MGAYADDVILLAPTKHSMHTMLDICMLFSSEFQMKFNALKSKLVVFGDNNDKDSILFEGQVLKSQKHERHLGQIIGKEVTEMRIIMAKDDLIRRMNVLLSCFKQVNTTAKIKLFNIVLSFSGPLAARCCQLTSHGVGCQ